MSVWHSKIVFIWYSYLEYIEFFLRITEGFAKGILKIIQFQSPAVGRDASH